MQKSQSHAEFDRPGSGGADVGKMIKRGVNMGAAAKLGRRGTVDVGGTRPRSPLLLAAGGSMTGAQVNSINKLRSSIDSMELLPRPSLDAGLGPPARTGSKSISGRQGSKTTADLPAMDGGEKRAGSKMAPIASTESRQGSKQVVSPTEGRQGSKAAVVPRSQSMVLRRRATISTLTGAQTEAPGEEEKETFMKEAFKPVRVRGPTKASAAMLVSKHRLEFHEVNTIVNAFESVQEYCTAGLPISRSSLNKALGKIFDVEDIMDDILDHVYTEANCARAFNIDKFLDWYVHNMFTHVAAMRGDPRNVASDKLVYELARKYDVSAVAIDKIKQRFDSFDEDRSGLIDYDEFKQMILQVLKARNISDVSEDRIQNFFRELDGDGSGEVDFEEFTEWYLKYFNSDSGGNSLQGGDNKIMEVFYGSFDPTKARSKILGAGAGG